MRYLSKELWTSCPLRFCISNSVLQILQIVSPYHLDTSYNVSHDLCTTISRRICAEWTATVSLYEKHINDRTEIAKTLESRTYHVQLEQGCCKVPVVSQLVGSL